jgi:endonuclease G
MHVIKSGRGSEITEGIVTGVEGLYKIPYGGLERIVRHVVHIAQAPGSQQTSAGGDSGSWWLEKSSYKAVGLHFAGSDKPEFGLAIAMSKVLNALNVDIVI